MHGLRDDSSDAKFSRPRILFLHPLVARFVQTDLDLLRTFCDVEAVHLAEGRPTRDIFAAIGRSDVVYSWFALEHAAVASLVGRLRGKKTLVVSGGWDVVGMPEIGYGRLLHRRGRIEARTALRWSDSVLAFSDWSAAAIRSVVPQAPVRRLYLGTDPEAYCPSSKEDIVVTIANVTRENLVRKGLLAFVHAAARIPEAKFVLVGRSWDMAANQLRSIAPANLRIVGWLSDKELRDCLARARVYVQASYTEGFGLALVEAMASACVPVVTPAGAIPEVVGNEGFYVEYGDSEALARAIRFALTSNIGAAARRRIVERFTVQHRLAGLRVTMGELLEREFPAGSVSPVRSTELAGGRP